MRRSLVTFRSTTFTNSEPASEVIWSTAYRDRRCNRIPCVTSLAVFVRKGNATIYFDTRHTATQAYFICSGEAANLPVRSMYQCDPTCASLPFTAGHSWGHALSLLGLFRRVITHVWQPDMKNRNSFGKSTTRYLYAIFLQVSSTPE